MSPFFFPLNYLTFDCNQPKERPSFQEIITELNSAKRSLSVKTAEKPKLAKKPSRDTYIKTPVTSVESDEELGASNPYDKLRKGDI